MSKRKHNNKRVRNANVHVDNHGTTVDSSTTVDGSLHDVEWFRDRFTRPSDDDGADAKEPLDNRSLSLLVKRTARLNMKSVEFPDALFTGDDVDDGNGRPADGPMASKQSLEERLEFPDFDDDSSIRKPVVAPDVSFTAIDGVDVTRAHMAPSDATVFPDSMFSE